MKGSRIPGPAVGNLGLVLREEKEANRKAKHSLPQTDSGFFGMFTRGLNPGTQAPPGLLLCPSESSVPNTLQQVGQAPGPVDGPDSQAPAILWSWEQSPEPSEEQAPLPTWQTNLSPEQTCCYFLWAACPLPRKPGTGPVALQHRTHKRANGRNTPWHQAVLGPGVGALPSPISSTPK